MTALLLYTGSGYDYDCPNPPTGRSWPRNRRESGECRISPLLSAMINGCCLLLSVSIEIVVEFFRGILGQADVQPFPKLRQLQKRSTGRNGSCRPQLLFKGFPDKFRFG